MSIDAKDVLELLQGQMGGNTPDPENNVESEGGVDLGAITETLKQKAISDAVGSVITTPAENNNDMLTLVNMMKEQQETNKILIEELAQLKAQKIEDTKVVVDEENKPEDEKNNKTLDKSGADATIKVDTSKSELENNLKQMKKEMLRVEYGLDTNSFSTIETVAKNLNVDLLTKPDYIPMIITELEKATNKPVGKATNTIASPKAGTKDGLETQVSQHIETSQALLSQYNITL